MSKLKLHEQTKKKSIMAFPVAAAIAAGASLIGGMLNRRRAKKQQEKANQYNIEQWNRTNEYNDPQAQMQRFMNAGLNPNLIYGQGSAGGGNASPAPEMESLTENAYQPLVSESSLQQFVDWDVKRAQTDNLKSQTTKNVQSAILDSIRGSGELIRNSRSGLELRKAKNMEQISYQAAEANLKKTLADTQYTLNQDERATIQNDRNVAESVAKVASMRLGMERTKLLMRSDQFTNQIKQLDAHLANLGVRANDPFYAKAIMQLIDKASTWFDQKKEKEESWWKVW